MTESCVTFDVQQKNLFGILHLPETTKSNDIGVLIIVGGPQTRVGSHRQFVLLSRFLMENGIASMRFDYRGMGDSEGEEANFLDVSDDIHGAINAFKAETNLKHVVLWGLCDAASSALIYQYHYPVNDVIGMVLLNPWVRSEQGEAKTIMKHYYLNRLKDPDLWRKIFSLKFDLKGSLSSFSDNLKKMLVSDSPAQAESEEKQSTNHDNYIQHMLKGLTRFQQQVLLVISGDDLTASEFLELLKSSKPWQQEIEAKVDKTHTIEQANHTFSTQQWRQEVEQVSLKWVNALPTLK